jgi:y4mF family transcriptional regulator
MFLYLTGCNFELIYTFKGILFMELSAFVKGRRKLSRLTQVELGSKAGVGLRFVRELEQGKKTLRMDKVNQVLLLFGQELGPVPVDREKLINEKS